MGTQVREDAWEVGEERPRARLVGRTPEPHASSNAIAATCEVSAPTSTNGGGSDTGIASKAVRPAATAWPRSASTVATTTQTNAPASAAPVQARAATAAPLIAISPTASHGKKPTARGHTRQRTS